MKNIHVSLKSVGLCAILAGALAQSCTKTEEAARRENDIVFDHFAIEQAYTLENSSTDYETDSDLTMGCRANLFIPVKFMGHDMTAFRDSVLKMAFDTVAADPAQAAETCFRRTGSEIGYPLKPIAIDEQEADSLANTIESLNNFDGFAEIQGRIAAMTPEYVSYAVTSSAYYPRAAHGMYGTFYIVYSAKADKMVSLSDFFTSDGLAALPKMLRKRAQAMRSYIGATNLTAIPGGGNYYINADGNLVFVYQPYEIASYAQGEISIDLEPYMVSDYLTPLGKQVLLNE